MIIQAYLLVSLSRPCIPCHTKKKKTPPSSHTSHKIQFRHAVSWPTPTPQFSLNIKNFYIKQHSHKLTLPFRVLASLITRCESRPGTKSFQAIVIFSILIQPCLSLVLTDLKALVIDRITGIAKGTHP